MGKARAGTSLLWELSKQLAALSAGPWAVASGDLLSRKANLIWLLQPTQPAAC